MSLDAPGGLWLLGTIPLIVLFWMLPPRRPRVRIPSVLLWPTSTAERRSAWRRPWQRLRNHPLLWLQLFIALLLAVAAAQPYVPAEAAAQRVVVLLDASGSMRAHDVQPSRWDAARNAVVDLARSLGPDQSLSVIRVDDQPRVLVADVHDAARVQSVLDRESPAYGPIDAATSVALANGVGKGGPSEWVLVGDGQFPDLPAGTTIPPGTRFRFVPIGSASAGNVALTGLAIRSNGSTLALQLGLRNANDRSVSGSVELLAEGGAVLATKDWSAGPRQDTYVGWDGVQSGPRWFEARLTSVDPPDANVLDTDDRAWAVASSPTSQQAVLLVSTGNTFLERVLAVKGNLRTFKVSPPDWPPLVNQGGASTYALVVLDRQPRDATPTPTGSALYIGGSSGDAFQPRVIAPVPDHPLLRNVDWSEVRIARAARLTTEQTTGWETVVDSDGGPLVLVRTLREADHVRREALLTFALGESDLALRSAFPVLMANLVEWLAPRAERSPQTIAPGATLQLDASPLASSVRIETAVDVSSQPDTLAPPWPPRPFRPAAPGVYRAIEESPTGPATTYLVADAFAPTEADLGPSQPVPLASQTGQTDDLAHILRGVRSGIWPWLLATMLALGAIEWVVDARGR